MEGVEFPAFPSGRGISCLCSESTEPCFTVPSSSRKLFPSTSIEYGAWANHYGSPLVVVSQQLALLQNLELTCASPGVLPSSSNFVRPFMRHQARALSALPLFPQSLLCAASGVLGKELVSGYGIILFLGLLLVQNNQR